MADALVLYSNRLFTGNRSQVHRWGRRLGNDFAGLARSWAPARSGELKASIFSNLEGQGKRLNIYVGSDSSIAPHNWYVLLGTGDKVGRPRIRNPHGKALPVGRDRAYGPKILVFNPGQVYFIKGVKFVGKGVGGQAPQNFFKISHQFLIPLHPSTSHIDWHDLPGAF